MNDYLTKLYADLGADAVQRTSKSVTKKGYDTTGYAYQYCVDRFNDVFGADWSYTWEVLKAVEGTYKGGTPFIDITVAVSIAIPNAAPRRCVGGHTAVNYADALKGAITNGFKKTAAFWGVGAKAFRGEIDDDNKPLPEKDEDKVVAPLVPKEPIDPEAASRVLKVFLSFDWDGKITEYKWVKEQIAKGMSAIYADTVIDKIQALKLPPKKKEAEEILKEIF